MLRSKLVLCVLLVIVISCISIAFAADVKIQAGKVKPDKELKLKNDTYLTARNYADTADVNVIKVNTSDVIIIGAGAELATSAAPTTNAGIANKKYVDDNTGFTFDGSYILGALNEGVGMTAADTWQTLDTTVSNALCFLEVYHEDADGNGEFFAKPVGYGYVVDGHRTDKAHLGYLDTNTAEGGYLIMPSDGSGNIYIASDSTSAEWTVKLIGYVK